MKAATSSAFLALPFLLAACGGEAPTTCTPLATGVPMVTDTSPDAWAAPPAFEELWRAGGDVGGEELGAPTKAEVSMDGRLALADVLLGEVVVLDADGTWLGAWATKGAGPGEVERPAAVMWDSGRVAVWDLASSSVEWLGPDGYTRSLAVDPSFLGESVRRGQVTWTAVERDGGVLLTAPVDDAGPGRQVWALVRRRPGAQETDPVSRGVVRVAGEGQFQGYRLPGGPLPLAAVGPLGRLAVAATDGSYRVVVYDSTGSAIQLCRAVPPKPLTPAETGEAAKTDAMRELLRSTPRPDTLAALGRVVLGAGGRIWVQRDRPDPSLLMSLFRGMPGAEHDVFDAGGHYLGTVTLPDGAQLQAALGDTVWVYETDDMDRMSIVAYRLAWGGS